MVKRCEEAGAYGYTVHDSPDFTFIGGCVEMVEDNWKHRSAGVRCRSCMFFVPKEVKEQKVNPEATITGQIGRCRACAPTMRGWPVVFENDWCGAHKLDEEKV